MSMKWKSWLAGAVIASTLVLHGCANMPTAGNTTGGAVVEGADNTITDATGTYTGTYGGDNGLQVGTISDDTLYGTGEDEAYWQDGGVITDDTASVDNGGGALYPDEMGTISDNTSIPEQAQADGMKPIIYFAFDSYALNANDRRKIRYFARKVKRDPRIRIRLEGHTDERGSLEYNLALGERRAKAVAREFHRNGISYRRMDVISYGELRPAVPGHNERAWALNRRVEMIFYRK